MTLKLNHYGLEVHRFGLQTKSLPGKKKKTFLEAKAKCNNSD